MDLAGINFDDGAGNDDDALDASPRRKQRRRGGGLNNDERRMRQIKKQKQKTQRDKLNSGTLQSMTILENQSAMPTAAAIIEAQTRVNELSEMQ